MSFIGVESGVSAFSGAGFVAMRWGAETGQFTPAEARRHALLILEAAEAAEHDAALVAVLKDFGLEDQAWMAILVAIREKRGS